MISRLPRWVEYGAFILALVAGVVNAIALLGFEHESTSHLSGITTRIGAGIVNAAFTDVLHLASIILSFVVGASISGYFLRNGALKLGKNYGGLLFIEAIFLVCAIFLLNRHPLFGHYLTAAACGLQNALASTYSGAIVRTTHVTGIFTDLGLMLGAKLRGERFDMRKALLFSLIILGFLLGGVLGAYLFDLFHYNALYIPASICLMLSLIYAIYHSRFGRH